MIEKQEIEFRDKVLKMEKEVKSVCEKNKDDVVSMLCKEMEE
jgi:hypothetical protein